MPDRAKLAAFVALGIWIGLAVSVHAQSSTAGVDAAGTLEKALVSTIARAERSVVAVARVQKDQAGDSVTPEFRPDPFGRHTDPPAAVKPTDPDFIPTEYATGVVIDANGLILTVYHALGQDSDYYVTTSGRKIYRAVVKAADPRSDLAVLAIDAVGLEPIALGNPAQLKKGQIVISLGNPYAIARDGQASAAWGIVANLARKAPPIADDAATSGKSTLHHFGTLIQTDARLNRGTSGGPLMNLKGEMIGLVTSLPAVAGYEETAGYAMPVDATFRRVIEILKQGREVEYGFLGIQPSNLSMDEVLAGQRGVRIKQVVAGSPAFRSGVKPSDLILAVNGVAIFDTDGLMLELGRLPLESTARIEALREGRRVHLDVGLTKYPVKGRKIVTTPAPGWRGLRIDYPTAVEELRGARRGVGFYEDGVIVTEVEKGTPAWEAGLRPGAIIAEVERTKIHTPREFRAAVASKTGPVELHVAIDSGETQMRTVRPGT
jgi:serine protease Do